MRRALLNLALISAAASWLPAVAAATPVEAALANPARLQGDHDADENRRPAEVLEFFGIEPGMSILEVFAGGGYYTEILSYVVGPEGRVVAHNNTPYLQWARAALEKRFTPGRLENVERLTAENNALEFPEGSFDAAVFILAYHDVYHLDEPNGWTRIDGPAMLAEVYRALKPGAVVGVVDHVAAAGSPAETANTLHRIDPALLRKDFEAAGFVFEDQSQALRNPQDDLGKPVFAKEVRGRTDRFIFRFRRP